MVAIVLRLIVLTGIWLAEPGQVAPAHPSPASSPTTESDDPPHATTTVVVARLEVFDQPDEKAYVVSELNPGDRVSVRKVLEGGWTAIDPPPMAIGWVPRTALDLGHKPDSAQHTRQPAGSRGDLPETARVIGAQVVVRSGQLRAKLPGPPWTRLQRGAVVRLVDRSPLSVGRGRAATTWMAIVPPEESICYIRSDGINPVTPPLPAVPEQLAAYVVTQDDLVGDEQALGDGIPVDVAAEIRRIDAMHHTVLASLPIDQWRFDTVRAAFQSLLKRAGDNRAVEETLRDRLSRVTRHDQAAKAARTFRKTLAESRRLDGQVAQIQKRLAAIDQSRTRTYSAVGFVQPSSRVVDGRKLHALIGSNGSTLAYLDIPAGIDVNSLSTRRVGVLGVTHYNQDLGTRLITVRDLETIESRR
ncbi:MAG: hypothetical protein ACLQGP_04805 [Isosphaeraceae bacterium]